MIATSDYGRDFPAIVGRGSVLGVQFHPEKSQEVGPAHGGELRAPGGRGPEGGMIVVPAIDIRQGRVVRLRQGRAEDETVYDDDPAEVARRWEAEGAERIHLVDLDAAIDGLAQPEAIGGRGRGGAHPGRGGGRPPHRWRTRSATATSGPTA